MLDLNVAQRRPSLAASPPSKRLTDPGYSAAARPELRYDPSKDSMQSDKDYCPGCNSSHLEIPPGWGLLPRDEALSRYRSDQIQSVVQITASQGFARGRTRGIRREFSDLAQ
nr:hypothetical protein CFP56_37079 [Quercus suber]